MSYLTNGAGEVIGHVSFAQTELTTSPHAEKWCFGCRKRLPHELWIVTGEWYDPETFWRCTRCKQARTRFGE